MTRTDFRQACLQARCARKPLQPIKLLTTVVRGKHIICPKSSRVKGRTLNSGGCCALDASVAPSLTHEFVSNLMSALDSHKVRRKVEGAPEWLFSLAERFGILLVPSESGFLSPRLRQAPYISHDITPPQKPSKEEAYVGQTRHLLALVSHAARVPFAMYSPSRME